MSFCNTPPLFSSNLQAEHKLTDWASMASCPTTTPHCCLNRELWIASSTKWRMARFRRKFCITLIALVLLVLIITVILKALTPEDSPFSGQFGMEVVPRTKTEIQRENNKKPDQIKMNDSAQSDKDAELEATLRKFPPPNYYLHAFYYIWFGNPEFDGKYIHWDHVQLPHWDFKVAQGYPQGRHIPPDDIGSNFYPSLGAYSSRDPSVIEAHMQQLRTAAIGKTEMNLNLSQGQ